MTLKRKSVDSAVVTYSHYKGIFTECSCLLQYLYLLQKMKIKDSYAMKYRTIEKIVETITRTVVLPVLVDSSIRRHFFSLD